MMKATSSSSNTNKYGGGGGGVAVVIGISLMTLLLLWSSVGNDFVTGAFATTTTTTTTTNNNRKKHDDSDEDGVCENKNSNNNVNTQHPHPNDPTLQLYHFSLVESTQDEAKRIITEEFDSPQQQPSTTTQPKFDSFCVTTREQINGRGTSGRKWMSGSSSSSSSSGDDNDNDNNDDAESKQNNFGVGNTFVTIGIPMSKWISSQIPLTLLPLKMGCLVANQLQAILDKYNNLDNNNKNNNEIPMVTVKWPNDVLVDEQKISGILIESHKDWFLIGIGVNLQSSPSVPKSGPNYGRTATCLSNHVVDYNNIIDWEYESHQLGVKLAYELHRFLKNNAKATTGNSNSNSDDDAANTILEEWKSWIDWDMELVMRDTPNRERVKLVNVLEDGRVQVIGQDDGIQRTLVSDYFL